MSPEKGIIHHPVMDEARMIRDELVSVQTRVEQTATATELELLEGVRERLGYEPAQTSDMAGLVDARIKEKTTVITPNAVASVLPVSHESAVTTSESRAAIEEIIMGDDDRLVVITGPCSLHDPEATLEYAESVKAWREAYGDDLEIIMRAYTEKPRTEKDWKGLIYDPLLDESDDINLGIVLTRLLSCQITHSGVPIATERLNALTPQYVNGLVAYDAIGARNTTDQKAREYASGTSSPVGFKNTPEGSVKSAAEAIRSANAPHTFLGMSTSGMPMQVSTTGNESAHIILRGSEEGPNYTAENIERTKQLLRKKELPETIVIDASHANSGKQADRQIEVVRDIAGQVSLGEMAIKGVMIESNLVAGKQKLTQETRSDLVYGQSITDECVDLDQTETMLEMLAEAVRLRRKAA